METFTRFLYEFLSQFFSGIITIGAGIGKGIGQLFNISEYTRIISDYRADFSLPEWAMVAIAILAIVLVYGMIILLVYFLIRKYFLFNF